MSVNHIDLDISLPMIDSMTGDQKESFMFKLSSYLPTLKKVTAWMGGGGLPDSWVYVIWEFDRGQPLHMGIDPEGGCST